MMARSTKGSNQRPDTLMQDRHILQLGEIFLQRTAGPYIWVRTDKTQREHNRSAFGCIATEASFSRHVEPDCRAVIQAPDWRGRIMRYGSALACSARVTGSLFGSSRPICASKQA